MTFTGSKIGYARVSTHEQDVAAQVDELQRAGCHRIDSDTASGTLRERPELEKALDYAFGVRRAARDGHQPRSFLVVIAPGVFGSFPDGVLGRSGVVFAGEGGGAGGEVGE